jgi:cobalt-zinc-cadmium efflux system outer membrane protein
MLPDPQVSFGVMSIPVNSFRLDQEPMTQKTIEISQALPLGGKLGLRKETARMDQLIAAQRVRQIQNELRTELASYWYELFNTRKSRAILKRNSEILTGISRIVAAGISSGKSGQQQLLRSQIEALRIEEKLFALNSDEATVVSKLNALLNRADSTAVEEIFSPDSVYRLITVDSLISRALSRNPEIAIARIESAKARIAYQLSESDFWPDLMVGVTYGQREKWTDFFGAGVSFALPVYAARKQSNARAEKYIGISAAAQALRTREAQISAEISALAAKLANLARSLELYRKGILLQAGLVEETALDLYRSGQSDFETMMESELLLLDYRMNYYRLLVNQIDTVYRIAELCDSQISDILLPAKEIQDEK